MHTCLMPLVNMFVHVISHAITIRGLNSISTHTHSQSQNVTDPIMLTRTPSGPSTLLWRALYEYCHMNYKLQITNFTFHSELPCRWVVNNTNNTNNVNNAFVSVGGFDCASCPSQKAFTRVNRQTQIQNPVNNHSDLFECMAVLQNHI